MTLVVSARIQAPSALVWSAYTTPADIVNWNAASDDWHTTRATVDLRAGGLFSSRMEAKDGSMEFDFEGTYDRIETGKLIEYHVGDRHVRITFDADDDAVLVTVSFDPENQHPLEMQQAGWQAILDNFSRYVASLG